jgi:tetratricopeptide (TPR) repeat protein
VQNRKITTRGILLRLLLLAIAVSGQFSIKARYWNQHYPETAILDYSDILLQSVPTQLKSMSAGIMRLTADEYMHIGPYKKARQNFIAGSFAGNTEIMILLRLALYLEPSHIETYEIMSQNLAMHLDRFADAIRLIQQGILANKNSADLHQLYAAAAYCYGFAESFTSKTGKPIKNDREIALNYLNAAIANYEANAAAHQADNIETVSSLDNYYLLKSRFLIDIGKKDQALAAWQHVPESSRNGLIATYFSLLEQGVKVPDSPKEFLAQIFAEQQTSKDIMPPYALPDGWYQTLFVDPADELKSISSALNRVSPARIDMFDPFAVAKVITMHRETQSNDKYAANNQASSCNHADHSEHDCTQHYQNENGAWTIFSEARGAVIQAVFMIAGGLLIRRFFTRRGW